MIWSMKKPELVASIKQLEGAKDMLKQTADYSGKLVNAEVVQYFELPAGTNSRGRVVMAFAHLLGSGHLDTTMPRVYGVICQPLTEDNPRFTNDHAVDLTQEHHVIAEDMALRNGIFTPYGRLTAEVAAIRGGLMPGKPSHDFAAARITHLDGLISSIEDDNSMTQHSQDRAAHEIHRAQRYLREQY